MRDRNFAPRGLGTAWATALPQGICLSPGGERIYVADYAAGLFRIELDTGVASR